MRNSFWRGFFGELTALSQDWRVWVAFILVGALGIAKALVDYSR